MSIQLKKLEAGENPHFVVKEKYPNYRFSGVSLEREFLLNKATKYKSHNFILFEDYHGTWYLFSEK